MISKNGEYVEHKSPRKVMSTSHTPGPWYVDGMGNDPHCLAITSGERPEGPDSQRENKIAEVSTPEDAQLICAAPDLLKALKGTMRTMRMHHGADCKCMECVNALEAINKAEGH